MTRVLLGRIGQLLAVVLLVTTASFFLVHLAPGEPFALDDPRVTPAVRAQWRAQFALDRPLGEQYVRYLANAARGEWGWSFSLQRPVGEAIAETLPRTLLLVGVGGALALIAGVLLGAWQSVRRGRPLARLADAGALLAWSLPDFWVGILLLLVFSGQLAWFPAGGAYDPVIYDYMGTWERFANRVHHLALPALTIALVTAGGVARYQRVALVETLDSDFVRTARAKGASERRVVLHHAMRNALLPVITLLGLMLPALAGGAVFVERVFSWNGMGNLVVSAIAARDVPLVTASAAIGGVMVAVGSLVADLLYAVADPRLRDP